MLIDSFPAAVSMAMVRGQGMLKGMKTEGDILTCSSFRACPLLYLNIEI